MDDSFNEQLLLETKKLTSKKEVFQTLPAKEINVTTLNQELQDLALRNGITFNCLKEILDLLHRFFVVDVTKDPRTILKTPRPNVKAVKLVGSSGVYFHLGLADVQTRLSAGLKGNVKVFSIKLFFDGMEMAKSMPGSAWPILGIIPESLDDTPFMIGVFYGRKKFTVHNIEDYLGDLVKDLHELLVNGVYVKREKYIYDPDGPIVCDRPAKSAIKCIVEFSSKFGCDKCDIKGVWIRNRRTYLSSNFTLRTDESFRLQENKDHHTGECPLVALPINMVDCFVVDYMHQCCLGTQKRLLLFYFGKAPKKSRIQVAKRTILNTDLDRYGKKCPRDFQRRPRSLMHYKKFKATEFRQLMLYTGIVYFKDAFESVDLYHHFLLFSLSMRVVCCPIMSKDKEILNWAEACIILFVRDSAKLFGKHFVVYNIHSLLHVVNDVRKYGMVDNFSAFPFENYLGKLRRSVRAYHHPLQQLVNRYQENNLNTNKAQREMTLLCPHNDGPVVSGIRGSQFKRLQSKTLSLSVDFDGDNFVKIGNETAKILNIMKGLSGTVYLVGRIMLNKTEFFKYPCSSSEFDIFLVDNEFSELGVWQLAEVESKCAVMPYKSKFVSIPLLHTAQ
ncbi:hypothetical protein FOCC_FOCC012648 [Frankliniella occidentalis]|nr:hypothetical protein FOCC_FOCC012648 [Frankliniella occidentalis]